MKKLTKNVAIARFTKIHGNTYDYSRVVYLNRRTKIEVVCRIHGSFYIRPENHKCGQGCPRCANKRAGLKQRITQNVFIKRANTIHNDKYNYSNVKLIKQTENISIICPTHGEFTIKPFKHLQGQGCKKCGIISTTIKRTSTKDYFIRRATFVHGDKYDYSEVVYINNTSKISILCPIHGDFEQNPNNHLQGSGCPSCQGWIDMKKPAICYYIVLQDYDLYKIGVTSKTKNERIHGEGITIKQIKIWHFNTANEAFKFEKKILEEFKMFRYNGDKLLRSGNTELFIKNVLNI